MLIFFSIEVRHKIYILEISTGIQGVLKKLWLVENGQWGPLGWARVKSRVLFKKNQEISQCSVILLFFFSIEVRHKIHILEISTGIQGVLKKMWLVENGQWGPLCWARVKCRVLFKINQEISKCSSILLIFFSIEVQHRI